jgi:uncharacterized protein YndB with AHSA1/START domain
MVKTERENSVVSRIQGEDIVVARLARVVEKKESHSKKATFEIPPGTQETILTRVYDAPRDKVYKAYTDPKIIPQFWGPASLKTTVDKQELRPGGMWRFVQRDRQGREYGFHGFYHHVSPERLVYTFEFEGQPGDIMLEVSELIEEDGRTRVVAKDIFLSPEARDAAVK